MHQGLMVTMKPHVLVTEHQTLTWYSHLQVADLPCTGDSPGILPANHQPQLTCATGAV